MGAGIYFTHKETGTVASFVDLGDGEETDLSHSFKRLGYVFNSYDRTFSNDLIKINLEPTYDGNGIVIYLEPNVQSHYGNLWNLAIATQPCAEKRILKSLIREGHRVRRATSGYTSRELKECDV